MGRFLVLVGASLLLYETTARIFTLPSIADFVPVDIFPLNKDHAEYMKIVHSEKINYWTYTPGLAGLVLIAMGTIISRKR